MKNNDPIHTITSTITTLAGLAAIVFLAMQGAIHDGETTTAIAAVLGIQIGTAAFRKRQDPPDGIA